MAEVTDAGGRRRHAKGAPASSGGQFAANRAEARGTSALTPPTVTPAPDAFGFEYPTSSAHLFEGASTFAQIDEVWKKDPHNLDVRWAAVNRGRELRAAGAPGVPTNLSSEGRGANAFAHAQNDLELYEIFEQCTEEPYGDGEASRAAVNAWYGRLYAAHDARRAELLAAGAVSGRSPLEER